MLGLVVPHTAAFCVYHSMLAITCHFEILVSKLTEKGEVDPHYKDFVILLAIFQSCCQNIIQHSIISGRYHSMRNEMQP